MALSSAHGPFSSTPAGSYDVDPPRRPLLYWEPFPKRLRVSIGGETVADSERVVALHESDQVVRLLVPWDDVRKDFLTEDGTSSSDRLGSLRHWSSFGRKRVAKSIDAPPPAASDLAGMVLFDLDRVDAWYLEDEPGYSHPRDPYHRFDVHRSTRHVVVKVGDSIVAEAPSVAMLFETGLPTRYYLPPDAIRPGSLTKSETVSECPYKGDGQHWHVVAGEGEVRDAAWSLTTPMGDALSIARWFSFYPDKVTVEVDGERLSE